MEMVSLSAKLCGLIKIIDIVKHSKIYAHSLRHL